MKKFMKFAFYGVGTFLLVFSSIIIGFNFVKDSGLFDKSMVQVLKQDTQKKEVSQASIAPKDNTPAKQSTPKKAQSAESTKSKKLSIEVINCTDKKGLAEEIRAMLETKGYDVSAGNHLDSSQGTSMIVERKEGANGDIFKDILKIPTVKQELQPDSRFDITILLGKDFNP
jgi:hypothetical protein